MGTIEEEQATYSISYIESQLLVMIYAMLIDVCLVAKQLYMVKTSKDTSIYTRPSSK